MIISQFIKQYVEDNKKIISHPNTNIKATNTQIKIRKLKKKNIGC